MREHCHVVQSTNKWLFVIVCLCWMSFSCRLFYDLFLQLRNWFSFSLTIIFLTIEIQKYDFECTFVQFHTIERFRIKHILSPNTNIVVQSSNRIFNLTLNVFKLRFTCFWIRRYSLHTWWNATRDQYEQMMETITISL